MDQALDAVSARAALLLDEVREHQIHLETLQRQTTTLGERFHSGRLTAAQYNTQLDTIRDEAIAMSVLLDTKLQELKRSQAIVALMKASVASDQVD